MKILLIKAQVKGYTRKDGTYVAPHSRSDGGKVRHEAGLYDTNGMTREQSIDLIRTESERLVRMLQDHGFEAEVEHSGSVAGPSSYVSAIDPDTGVRIRDLRVSSHSKGVFNSTLVRNVAGDGDFQKVVDEMSMAQSEARKKPGYVPLGVRQREQAEADKDATKRRLERREYARSLVARRDAGESLTGKEKREVSWYEHEVKVGRLEKALDPSNGWKPPTPAQAKAGNYKKPRVRWNGLEIAIENPAGSVREGKGWRTKMKYDYGYVCRSEAVDGDEVDVYLGPDIDTAPTVYVVHQRKYGDWKAYDEDKAMLGFASEKAAREAYLAHYDDPRFLGPITAMPVDEFVEKVKATREKPAMIKAVLFIKPASRFSIIENQPPPYMDFGSP